MPRRYLAATLQSPQRFPADFPQRDAYANAVARVQRLIDEPGTLALLGGRGVGKTWIACGLVLDLCRSGTSARRLHVADYFDGLKDTYSDRSRMSEVRYEHDHTLPYLLVLDEMHERADTAWEDRKLTRLITRRHEMELATLLVSNETRERFVERVGDSVASRCIENAGGVLICDWSSLRRPS